MITYRLICGEGHEFEGWFKDSAAYDLQAAEGKLTCPSCNSRKVEKAVMAPAIAGKAREQAEKLGGERYIEVRYEDLVRDPEPALRRICASASLPRPS